jgi:light-regulated signal transduction histidine kinase (bacteriophytochrome)
MKTGVFFTAFSIVALSVFLIYARFGVFDHNISISVSEDQDTYTFSARYADSNTGIVERYINKCISPDQLGTSGNDYIDVTTSLPDGTRFYVKESTGKLKIKFDKRINSAASFYRIKKMCDGIKEVLAGK